MARNMNREKISVSDGCLRHADPNFSGFEERGGDVFFYANGVEHTYWQTSTLSSEDKRQLDKARKIFSEQGLAAVLKYLNTPW